LRGTVTNYCQSTLENSRDLALEVVASIGMVVSVSAPPHGSLLQSSVPQQQLLQEL